MGISMPEGLTAELTKMQQDVESTLHKIEVAMKGATESDGASEAFAKFVHGKTDALKAIGETAHACQDFYSHTNWEDKESSKRTG